MRSDLGGAHTSLGLAVSAYVVTGLSALMLYHGVVVAARAQDAAAPPAPADDEVGEDVADAPGTLPLDPQRVDPEPGVPQRADVETHEAYTFKRGKRIGGS
jgi:hypothetical protein